MKHLFALLLFVASIAWSQDGCTIMGACQPEYGGMTQWLVTHDCYPQPDCDAPNCPGFKCSDLYYLFQYNEPCGSMACYYCAQCASLNKPGVHRASVSCPVKRRKEVSTWSLSSFSRWLSSHGFSAVKPKNPPDRQLNSLL